jgi:hypothetical protein
MYKQREITLTKRELETLEKFIIKEMVKEEGRSLTMVTYRVLKSVLRKIARVV